MTRRLIVLSALILGCSSPTQVVPERPLLTLSAGGDYTITEFGTFGGDYSTAIDINSAGQVVGQATTASGHLRAFLWEDGVIQGLGDLTEVVAINDQGTVLGHAHVNGTKHAFVWSNGAQTDLGTLGGGLMTATAINEMGQVSGYGRAPGGDFHAFHWSNGALTDLGTLGGTRSLGTDINNHGHVVGWSLTGDGAVHAAVWESGPPIGLGQFDNAPTLALAINDLGHVMGVTAGTERAFFWNDGMQEIAPLPGYAEVSPVALNGNDQVIADARNGPGFQQGFLWQGGVATPLGAPGGPIVTPFAISERGEIVGRNGGRAFSWRDGDITDLHPTDPAYTASGATAVNEEGWIVGFGEVGANSRSWLWQPVTTPIASSPAAAR